MSYVTVSEPNGGWKAVLDLERPWPDVNRTLSIAAHDLRNPVIAMIALTETLSEECSDSLSPQAKEIVADLLNAGETTLRLIENLLDFSTAHSRRLRFSEVDLHEIVGEAMRINRAFAARSGLRLVRHRSPIPSIQADRSKLFRVLNELIWNAMQASPKGGLIEVLFRQRGRNVEVAVQDQGAGIRPEKVAKLFVAFSRKNRELTEDGNRIRGLGLSIVREIVEAHGGHLRVAGRPRGGTTFIVSLPIVPSKRDALAARAVS